MARSVLGYKSPVYRLAARVLTTFEIIKNEGYRTYRELQRVMNSQLPEEVLSLQSLDYSITVRPGTDDVPALINNAVRKEYGRFKKGFSPKVIIDAGAYIGDTSAYFLSRFPEAHVIALEPNPESYDLAIRNLAPYGERVKLIQAALWNEVSDLKISGEQMGAALANEGIEIKSVTIPSLMGKFGLEFIDVLKLDIEGAEIDVLLNAKQDWLDKVGLIMLETHGKKIEEMLIPFLTEKKFSCERYRNVWYCSRVA